MKNKKLLSNLLFFRFPKIPKEVLAEYRRHKFHTNNYRVLIVGAILFVEQFLLGVIVAPPGSQLKYVYFISSTVMGCFAVIALLFINNKPDRVSKMHEVYEMCFAIFGMVVAVGRFLGVETEVTSLPTIYIAVLYGVAVIFIFSWWQSLLTYFIMTAVTVILLPTFHPEISSLSFISDIITNGIIAWLIVHLNSRRFTGTFLDKKHIEMINLELRERSIRDGLTGLYNRRKLDEVLAEVSLKAARYNNDFAVMIMDIDNFKNVNDSHGHHVGDTVLVEFSRIIERNIREVDVCGRWGGEEFLVICQETELKPAWLLAERLRENIEKYSFNSGLRITASFGLAGWNECEDLDFLIKAADSRLYKAKKNGRNTVVAGSSVESGSLFDGIS